MCLLFAFVKVIFSSKLQLLENIPIHYNLKTDLEHYLLYSEWLRKVDIFMKHHSLYLMSVVPTCCHEFFLSTLIIKIIAKRCQI